MNTRFLKADVVDIV